MKQFIISLSVTNTIVIIFGVIVLSTTSGCALNRPNANALEGKHFGDGAISLIKYHANLPCQLVESVKEAKKI